jgi:hypothetical protein
MPEYGEAYLRWVRSNPCCVCGDDVHVEAHHPRLGWIEEGIAAPGLAQKASNRWAVALCSQCHRDLHAFGSEREYWASLGLSPLQIALNYQGPQ